MNEKQAMTLVAKMFAAHGSLKPAEVVAELAIEALESACSSCAKAVLETGRGGAKPLTVQSYRDAYQRSYASPEHQFHVGQDETQVEVGKLEARWRTTGVDALVDAGMPRDRARVAAAMQWANGIESPGLDLDIAAWSRHTPARITEDVIEAAWTYARAIAAKDPVEMSDSEWRRVSAPWWVAFREANAG